MLTSGDNRAAVYALISYVKASPHNLYNLGSLRGSDHAAILIFFGVGVRARLLTDLFAHERLRDLLFPFCITAIWAFDSRIDQRPDNESNYRSAAENGQDVFEHAATYKLVFPKRYSLCVTLPSRALSNNVVSPAAVVACHPDRVTAAVRCITPCREALDACGWHAL